MSDIYRRDTGSVELDRILADRDRIRDKMYPVARSPTVAVAEEIAVPIEPETPAEEVDTLPQFPFLPRLGEHSFSDWSGPAKIRHIQRVVANHFGVTVIDMVSVRRTKNVIHPRMVAMYFSRILTTRSFPDIGRRFCGRDHTTVIHAYRKIERLIADDAEFAREIEVLRGMLA